MEPSTVYVQTNSSKPSSYSPKFTDPTPKNFEELKATHTVILGSAYFINEYCKSYNDDFMLCKRDYLDPAACAEEGRKVTRCAVDLFKKLQSSCGKLMDSHWQCLDDNNNHMWKCREKEKEYNQCVFEKLGLKKEIPGAPDYELPIHMRTKRLYK